MEQAAYSRRSSYGPSSPVVGERGARTRRQIVDAALLCFTEAGFHGTAVEDIAERAETSRATLYQYFESKAEIFIELMYESGNSLTQVNRRLRPLGATAEGFDNLHTWLDEWTQVFEQYAPMFIEWYHVNTPKAELRPKLARFVDSHVERFTEALNDGGFEDDKAEVMAVLTLAVVNRYSYLTHVYEHELTRNESLASLTIALQLLLFPDTARAVLEAVPTAPEASASEHPIRTPMTPLVALPRTDASTRPDPFDGLSAQAAATVRQLLDAAGRVFADRGYEATNIDHIVTEAGLARGTFYRYFDDKLEVITVLARECGADLIGPYLDLGRFADESDPEGLRELLVTLLDLHTKYAGVIRAWTEGTPFDAQVFAPCHDILDAMGKAVRALFGPRRSYPLERRAMGMVLNAVLEQFPTEAQGSTFEPTGGEVVDAQALFIERVLLAR